MDAMQVPCESLRYELRFGSLFNSGRAFVFPCDAAGRVDCSGLTDSARRNYRVVCASVRGEVGLPELRSTSAEGGRWASRR
ncbi:MAG TPA: hypothetical protein VFP68_00050 [Burkholderiaceae bacterium]|nr:hypothetical protein [Burkholderiaceae bacterium]